MSEPTPETPAEKTPEQLYAEQMALATQSDNNGAAPVETQTEQDNRVIVGGVDLTGVQLTAEQIEALESAALRQQDYTRKTQKLAEEKRAFEARSKKAEIAERLEAYFEKDPEALKILSARMMGDRTTSSDGQAIASDLPGNWDEMNPAQQANWFLQKSAGLVASQIAPELKAIRRDLDTQKKLSSDESALYEAYPEVQNLSETDPLVELTDRLYNPDAGVSLVDAYEEASRLLGQQTEKIERTSTNAKKRAAASLAKPANSSNVDVAPDSKAFKRDTDYYDAVKAWTLTQMRRI